jgi:hypothetical protein
MNLQIGALFLWALPSFVHAFGILHEFRYSRQRQQFAKTGTHSFNDADRNDGPFNLVL